MLKPRLVPLLLLKNGRMVKTRRFADPRDVGHPVTTAKIYDAQGADELVFLDIAASAEGRRTTFEIVTRTAEQCYMPLTVGGGVRSVDDIRELLKCGADKVAINTAAVERPELVTEAARRFGAQVVVVSIDYRVGEDGRAEVYTVAGTKPTGLDPVEHARRMAQLGAGEILLTDIDRDGMMRGYDLAMCRRVASAVTCPVVLAGGVGTLDHFVEGIREGGAAAVAAASIFHFTDQSVIKAKAFMRQAGVDVRMDRGG